MLYATMLTPGISGYLTILGILFLSLCLTRYVKARMDLREILFFTGLLLLMSMPVHAILERILPSLR